MFIGESGIRIKNIKAGTLYGYNLGVRSRYDYIPGVLSKSLFSEYMVKHGMDVRSSRGGKVETTRDVICLDFDFGSRSYEEEVLHITNLIESCNDEDELARYEELLRTVENNKFKYVKKSKEEIREEFYKNGVTVRYDYRDKKGNVTKTEYIHYKMLYRNSSKAKLGQVMFINETLYERAYKWLTMNIGRKLPKEKAKIVEMSAYAPLTTSTIEGKLYIPVEDVLILKDQDSFFKAIANVVRAEEYTTSKRVVDIEKTECARERAIKDNKLDLWGNPIYKQVYKTVPVVKKKCVVHHEMTDVKNTLWDGMGLVETSVMPSWINGMALLRNHFFKMCGFRTKLQQFIKDYCSLNGIDYNTFEIEDMFGVKHRARDIKIVTTNNAIKWLKFKELMGTTQKKAYQFWCNKINADGSYWGVVKTDHPSKLGGVQQMSYQMVNTLPCTQLEVEDIVKTSVDYVMSLKNDDEAFVEYLKKNANLINHYDMLASMYEWNPDIGSTRWYRSERTQIVRNYVNRLKAGKITVNADNLTMCGNPYALLLYMVGEDWSKDPTLSKSDGEIQCYTKRFKNGENLCAFRSPHNSPNNTAYLRNTNHPLMEKYFEFSKNIVAVNCIETDIQPRLNGADFDSDFIFVTNEPVLVDNARRCYENFPTIVNDLQESGVVYDNTPEDYAKMDNNFAKTRMGIGYSSNLCQLGLSYYWTRVLHGIDDDTTKELYDNFIILSVLAQLLIDSCKRLYEVDGNEEIDRIKKLPCMKITDDNGNPKDFPMFMKYTRPVATTKNGDELPFDTINANRKKIINRINTAIECPMNWVVMRLSKIPSMKYTQNTDISDYFIKVKGKDNWYQTNKARKICERLDRQIKEMCINLDDEELDNSFKHIYEECMDELCSMKIRNDKTINRLIETALSIDSEHHNPNFKIHNGSKYSRRLLNCIFSMDKWRFLANFSHKIENIE